MMELPDLVREIEVIDGKTPTITGLNGEVGVFVQKDSDGWNLKKGDALKWAFEKTPLTTGEAQALGIGYIKDGIMYSPQLYQEELSGVYELSAKEEGVYYLYFICASSDPVSLEESDFICYSYE